MSGREISLILTALRYFQSHAVGDNSESMLTGLTADRIDELCQKLNAGSFKDEKPRVIVVVEGGNVQNIFADRPLNVDVLDHDQWDDTDRVLDPTEWSGCDSTVQESAEGA